MDIVLRDNIYDDNVTLGSLCRESLQEASNAYEDLSRIAGKKLADLVKENSDVFVFPPDVKESKDKIGELPVLELFGSKDDVLNVKIHTGNLMGFLGVGKTRVRIKSRFDGDNNDFFLHYLLTKVFHVNLVDLKNSASSEDDVLSILSLLFPSLLNAAMRKGVFRAYHTFKRNDASVKGAIDFAGHIKCNIPFNGRIAYNCREFSRDNELTQLIRHTIEVIRSLPFGNRILNADEELRRNVKSIEESTVGYVRGKRLQVITKNMKPLKNGYYSEYEKLRRLCLLILRHKTLRYANESNKVYGILFDGAWLWEEYLWTILKECEFKHPCNKQGKSPIYLFDGNHFSRYPDFFIPHKLILDAKYKRMFHENIGHVEIKRDDIHQLISYLYVEKVMNGGFIYPVGNDCCNGAQIHADGKVDSQIIVTSIGTLRGYGAAVKTYGFRIPQGMNAYKDFSEQMKARERELINKIQMWVIA